MPSRRQCSQLARNRHRHTRFAPVSSSARAAGRRPALSGWGADSDTAGLAMSAPLIERFRDRLPVSDATPVVSLGEGSTPLLRAPRLGERLGVELWLKWEASNPTASYKDRGMTVAVSKAVEDGARAVVCASTGNTSASAAAYAARAGSAGDRAGGRERGPRQADPGAGARRTGARGARDVRPGARRQRASSASAATTCSSTRSTRTGSRASRRRCSRSSRSSAPRRTPSSSRTAGAATRPRTRKAIGGAGPRSRRPLGRGRRPPAHPRERDPHRAPRPTREPVEASGAQRARGHGRGDRRGLARARARGGPVLRAVVRGRARLPPRRATSSAAPASSSRSRGTGSRTRARPTSTPRRRIVVDPDPDAIARGARSDDRSTSGRPRRRPTSGSGFDCAGVALDLWNELEAVESDGTPPADTHHLGIAAFARVAPVDGWRFDFTYRIPRSSGLGSSASLIALGLVAGAIAAGIEPDAEALLAEGLPLEGHPDNLAAALVGGACLTWDGRIERVADSVPAEPIALRPPAEQVSTEHSRSLLADQRAARGRRVQRRPRGAARRGARRRLGGAVRRRARRPAARAVPLGVPRRRPRRAARLRARRDALRLRADGDRLGTPRRARRVCVASCRAAGRTSRRRPST